MAKKKTTTALERLEAKSKVATLPTAKKDLAHNPDKIVVQLKERDGYFTDAFKGLVLATAASVFDLSSYNGYRVIKDANSDAGLLIAFDSEARTVILDQFETVEMALDALKEIADMVRNNEA